MKHVKNGRTGQLYKVLNDYTIKIKVYFSFYYYHVQYTEDRCMPDSNLHLPDERHSSTRLDRVPTTKPQL